MISIYRQFDAIGFMEDPASWSWELAQQLASDKGLGILTSEHRMVIESLRNHYLQHKSIPVMRHVCHESGLPDHCVSDLFENPTIAWRIAGLPDPGEEARAYMDTAEIKR